jgi:uncharacterized protein
MKPIQFTDNSCQRVYDAYMLRCKRATRILSAPDSEEVMMEINSHIFEYMSEHPASPEMKTLLDILDRLGAPEDTLRDLVADKKVKQATTTYSPLHVLQALALNIGNGFIYILLSLLVLLLITFPVLAVLKIVVPDNVGLFTGDTRGFRFGFSDHPERHHEWLGGWFIPVAVAIALLLYYTIILLFKWTRRIKQKKISLRTSLVTLLLTLGAFNGYSQKVTGDWQGKLKAGAIELRIVFHVVSAGDGYSATMDSPDESAYGIALSAATYRHDTLRLELQSLQIVYTGVLRSDSLIAGTFKQGPQSFPMTLSQQTTALLPVKRPQEPVKPYPYREEDLYFTNQRDHIDLAGTLTMPNKGTNFPAVVLITGSGPQNRDEELLGHKPFLVISDYLTRNGIAVLRFDDRGIADSKGVFSTATTLDFSYDAEAAVDYLKGRKEIDPARIGLIGHSEGGLIAPMIAARSKDVAFIVLLAGPGLRGDSIILLQESLIEKVSGMADSDLQKTDELSRGALAIAAGPGDRAQIGQALQQYFATRLPDSNGSASRIRQLTSPWMHYFLTYDPVPALEKVHCPVLAIGGDKDLQVPAAIDLAIIKNALAKAGNQHVTTQVLPGLNHLFQTAQTGSPNEYSQIEETFSPTALTLIGNWILQLKH